MSTDNEILYRIFKDDAERSGMDMKDFYHKRRKGLYPFRTPEGEVVWLKKEQFRIMSVVKRPHAKPSKGSRKNEKDKGSFFTPEMVRAFIVTGSGIVILFFIVKLIQVLHIF